MVTFSIEPSITRPNTQTVNVFMNGRHVATIRSKKDGIQIVPRKNTVDPEKAVQIERTRAGLPLFSVKLA